MYEDVYRKIDLKFKINYPKIREEPYTMSKKGSEVKERLKFDVDDFERFYNNFLYDHETWRTTRYADEMDFFYRRRIQQLCKGIVRTSETL